MIQKPLFILAIFLIGSWQLVAQNQIFAKSEMIADLEYLKSALEQNHPNLYTYSSKATIDNWFEETSQNLPDSINQSEAFIVITSISSVLKDGHSYIYPSAQHLNDFFNTAPLFPLDVFLTNESLVVVRNYSDEQNIPLGASLTKINEQPVSEMLDFMVQHTCRDGDNITYPKHLVYQFFPAYYSYFYGFQDRYTIEYMLADKQTKTVEIAGLPRSEIKSKRGESKETGIDLQILPNGYSAVLTVPSFDIKILKQDYQQNFKKEIKNIFKTIKASEIKILAIDLRDNQGGALSNGVYLLQQFMDTSFQCVNSFTKVKNGQNQTFNAIWAKHFKPNKEVFTGKVYVFTNGGSYSCSSIVANTIKEYNRGLIVGEMTGGSAYVNSGGPNQMLDLPNTKISFTIPKTQYNLRQDMSQIELGVVPDIPLIDSPNKILNGNDNYLEFFETQK